MELKNKIGDRVPCGELLKEVMGGETMELYSITLTFLGDSGVTQQQIFRKSKEEEMEE